jgi:uncharacterized protein (UPF0332 family)
MTREKHPPKKKHPNKPRSDPIVPLTEAERVQLARQEYATALVHLAEAAALSAWGGAPNACMHASYYAMEHCAAAAILMSGGVGKRKDFPRSHAHIVEHFGRFIAAEPGDLGECGRMLSRAQNDRLTADYGVGEGISRDDAKAAAAEARRFVDACTVKWFLTWQTS